MNKDKKESRKGKKQHEYKRSSLIDADDDDDDDDDEDDVDDDYDDGVPSAFKLFSLTRNLDIGLVLFCPGGFASTAVKTPRPGKTKILY